jgi:TatD DNase family protein
MELIDTHAHLYLPEFFSDLKQVVQRARAAGVFRVLLPNIDTASIAQMHEACSLYPDFFSPMMGFHPCSFSVSEPRVPEEIRQKVNAAEYFGVGEIGLDAYWDQSTLEFQQQGFIEQMIQARDCSLPVSIHCRDAFDIFEKCLHILVSEHGFGPQNFHGVLHCFTGTAEQGRRALDAGFYLGVGGVITYKKSGLAETLAQLPVERMVLETDAPYLPPVPFRGKRNEPAYLRYVAEALAAVKNMTLADVAEVTTRNAMAVFFDHRS